MVIAGSKGRSGRTVVELAVASTAMLVVLGVSIPAFLRISKAGDEGRTRLHVESDNTVTLTRIARELQNTSLKLLNEAGQPVVVISADLANAPEYLVALEAYPCAAPTAGAGSAPQDDAIGGPGGKKGKGGSGGGGTSGSNVLTSCLACKGGLTIGHSCGAPDGTLTSVNAWGGTPLNPQDSGSGRRGQTLDSGRARSTGSASITLGDGTDRARTRALPGNSILRFQKAMDFDVDGSGEVTIEWSTPIEYRTQGRRLVRIQDGRTQVVTSNCSCFWVEQTDVRTIVVSIVSERRAPRAATTTRHANQIEVRPKN